MQAWLGVSTVGQSTMPRLSCGSLLGTNAHLEGLSLFLFLLIRWKAAQVIKSGRPRPSPTLRGWPPVFPVVSQRSTRKMFPHGRRLAEYVSRRFYCFCRCCCNVVFYRPVSTSGPFMKANRQQWHCTIACIDSVEQYFGFSRP